jgi:hypothetical protein
VQLKGNSTCIPGTAAQELTLSLIIEKTSNPHKYQFKLQQNVIPNEMTMRFLLQMCPV